MLRVFPVGIIPAFIVFILLNRASKKSIDEAMLPKNVRQDKRSTAEIIGRAAGKGVYKLKNLNNKSLKSSTKYRVTNCKVSSFTEAVVWIGTNKKELRIPTRKLMYAFSDQNNWDEIERLELSKDTLGELTDEVFNLLEQDNSLLAEVLLKVAGEHPNPIENDFFRNLFQARE